MEEYFYESIPLGIEASFKKKITLEDIKSFSIITGDTNPLHLEKKYASTTNFKEPIVFGLLVNSLLSTLAGMHLPGKYALILSVEAKFRKPCFENDELTISGKVIQKIDAEKIIKLKTIIQNQNSEIIQDGNMLVKVLK